MEPDIEVPSGLEVESARLHTPAIAFEPPLHEDGGLRSRVAETVSDWKSRGTAQLTRLRTSAALTSEKAKSAVAGAGPKLQAQMRSDPKKWAGIAAGAGVVLGLAGRYMRHRSHVRARRPQIVIVEASC